MHKILFLLMFLSLAANGARAADGVLTGSAAYGGTRSDAPGLTRLIRPGDMPAPFAGKGAAGPVRDGGAKGLHVPAGFQIAALARGLAGARTLRFAPNGDLFVARMREGVITVIRPTKDGTKPASVTTFADGLDLPFGLAFYPADNPRWLYVGTQSQIIRLPYSAGDLSASGPAEVVVNDLPKGGHVTRDVLFSKDGKTLFVAVGSGSNIAEGLGDPPAGFVASHALGAAWGHEDRRADVLAFTPDGAGRQVYATGIRNCAAMALAPNGATLWCAVNERDQLGDDLPPDYVTSVKAGATYGWPWYYIGSHADPRQAGHRADLAGKVTVPDVLIQPHSAPLGIAFYDGGMFPAAMRGDAFVALHGSWNRSVKTGYKIVRVPMKDGRAVGTYQDFVTGFVDDGGHVSGRPVSVTVAPDGALLFSDDSSGTVWRVTYAK